MTDRPSDRFEPEDRLLWGDLFLFLRRRLGWILVPALIAGLGAGIFLALQPAVFEAAALLTLGGDRPVGEFTPPILSADGYLRLLRSRAVLTETRRRLGQATDGSGAESEPVELDLTPRLLASRRGELGNTSLLELVARADSADAASGTANAWAEAFLAVELRQVQIAALQAGYHELLNQQIKAQDRYERARDRLTGLKGRLAETPPTLSMRSRVADEQILAGATQGSSGSVILTQQINPVYGELAGVVATTEAEVSAMESQVQELTASRAKLAPQIEALRAANATAAPVALSLEPVPGVMLPAYGGAQLVGDAVPPLKPLGRSIPAKALLAAVGGAILGILFAAAREAVAPHDTVPRDAPK